MAAPIADPFLLEQYFQTKPNPRVGLNPARNFGVDALQPGTVDAAIQGQAPAQYSQFGLPTIRRPQAPAPSRRTVFDPPAPSRTSFNPATGEFAVDGRRFVADDDAAFLEADKLLSGEGPPTGPQMPEGFLPISPINIQGRAANIRNAGFGTRVAKGFEGGIEQAKLLGGAALEAFGAQETGRAIVEDATKELAKLAPYSGEFTDIDSAGDALNWTAYMIGELGPGVIQTAAAALLGGGVGAVGALALRKTGGKLLKQAAKKQRAGEALNAAETKALTNSAKILAATRGKVASTAARRGALAGAGLEAYGSGVGEVAAEIIGDRGDQGPMSAEDRLTAILGGIPVAAVDFLPEYGIFETLFRGTRFAPTAASRAGAGTFPGASRLRRAGGAAAVGGAFEGLAEAGQEYLIGELAGTDKTAEDYINALAAGALGGSIISGSAGLLSPGQELKSDDQTDLIGSEQQKLLTGPEEQLRLTDERPLRLTDERAQLALPAPERGPEIAVAPPVDPEATPRQLLLTDRRSFGPPEPTDLDLERERIPPEQAVAIKKRDARILQGRKNYRKGLGNMVLSPDQVAEIKRAGNEALKAKGRRDNWERSQPLIQEATAASRQSARDEPLRRAGVRGDAAAPGNVRLRVAAESGLGFPDIVEDTPALIPAPTLPRGQIELFPDDPSRPGVRSDVPGGQGELFNDVTAPIPEAPRTPVDEDEDERQLGLFDPPDPDYRQREFDFGSTPEPEPEPGPGPTPEPGFEFAEDVSPNVATDYVLPYLGKGGKEATMTDTPQNMARRTVDWIRAVRNAKEKLKTC